MPFCGNITANLS